MSDAKNDALLGSADAAVVENLRRAVSCLTSAHKLISTAAAEDLALAVGDANRTARKRISTASVFSRLRNMQRSLEEAAELFEAPSEDALVELTLRQHDKSLMARDEAEKLCRHEEQALKDMRCQFGDLCRETAHVKRQSGRLEEVGGSTIARLHALEDQRQARETYLQDIEEEAAELAKELTVSIAKNFSVDVRTKVLDEKHANNVAANIQAKEALGDDPSLEAYKRTKGQERVRADALVGRVEAKCESEIDRLNAHWADTQAKHKRDVHDMKEDVQALQALLAEKRKQAEDNLAKQAAEHRRMLEEVETKTAAEIQHLEGVKQQKTMALRAAIAQARQQMTEAQIGCQRNLEISMTEAKLAYRNRVRAEEARCEEAIDAEKRAAENAAKDRAEMERKAARAKEHYIAHTVKSGDYVKSLDFNRRKRIMDLWTAR